MAKSRDAFRTISEVSDALETPAHVLRFWESKFSQIKPVKRAGGRRYYRPDDVSLLIGIKHLLHDQGMTIKGAQKLLREKGVKHVVGIGEDLDSPEQTMAPTLVETKPDATVQAVTDIMQSQKTDETQTEMFDAGESDIEVIEDRPTPQLKIISAKHVPDEAPETKAMDAPSDRHAAATDNTPQATKDDAVPISALSPFAKPKPLLPSNPAARADMPARCLAAATRAKPERVKENVAEIAPLISRLIALRDEMRHPW